MRLGRGVEWAVHSCTLLAALADDEVLPASGLAEFFDLPPAYLAKHLQSLSAAGLITALRGPTGGYRLRRPPSEITLLEVIEAVEGGLPAFRCTEIRRRGPTAAPADGYPLPCGIARAMWRAEAAWRAELRATTIDDLIHASIPEIDPRQAHSTASWMSNNVRPAVGD